MSSTTLWKLPAQPSPKSDVTSSVFVTLWAFSCVIFASLFHLKLSGSTPVWPEFKSIRGSAILLAVWYTATAADRWLHYEQRVLPYGYILFEPVLHIIRVISTIWFLWGTYKVVWNELERRFETKKSQGAWWLAAKVSIFIVGLVSFFHVVLRIAMAVVWLQFLSLNIIADVTTKCNDFELAMTAFFTVFGILTIFAAVATIFFRARKREGSWAKTRVYLVLATVMLFFRSLAECVLVSMAHYGVLLRRDTGLPYDIAYGLSTCLYLLFMYLQTCQLASKLDTGTSDADNVKSDVRAWILYKLGDSTRDHKLVAPAFKSILDEAGREIPTILEQGPLSLESNLTPEKKRKVATSYINQLRKQFSHLAPQPRTLPPESQPGSNRGRHAPSGRQSAPISSSMYESLRNTSDPHIRKLASAPNMRGTRFGPRGLHEATSNSSIPWQPNIASIEERQQQPQASLYPTPGPVQYVPAGPTDPNAPSFSDRAQAVGFLGGEQRSVSDPVVPSHQQRRRFGPQPDNAIPIHEAGQAQFQAQPSQVYPPDSYAPRPQAYPAQSISSMPGSPQPQTYTPLPAQVYVPQYIPQAVDSQTTVGAYSDTTTAVPAEQEPGYPPAQPQPQPQPQRRRFEPGRTSSPLVPIPTQGGPPTIVPIPQAEPSPERYNPREFGPASPPAQAPQTGFPQQPVMFQFQRQGPGPVYAETVTDSDVASSRSPVNFNFALPDLGQENPPNR
ncbi:hypothetical protein V8F20_001002 [Naviculisporaceae sp. PSN 640]